MPLRNLAMTVLASAVLAALGAASGFVASSPAGSPPPPPPAKYYDPLP